MGGKWEQASLRAGVLHVWKYLWHLASETNKQTNKQMAVLPWHLIVRVLGVDSVFCLSEEMMDTSGRCKVPFSLDWSHYFFIPSTGPETLSGGRD